MALSMTSSALRLPGSSRAVFQPARTGAGRRISFVVRAEQSLGDKIEEKTKVSVNLRTLIPRVQYGSTPFAVKSHPHDLSALSFIFYIRRFVLGGCC